MAAMIQHSRPTLGAEEAATVAETIMSGHIAQGAKVAELEANFASFLGLKRAVAVNSGTSALHLALLALGTKPGDEVIIPDYVCTALLNAVYYTGATPIIADVDEADGNLDCRAALRLITPKTRAVIVPHMFGNPCAGIMWFRERGIPVIEDCAQSVGAELAGRKAGTLGDLSIFSFYATKVMTCGEGGMVAGNSPELTAEVADLCDYDNRSDYRLRYNYKMTDIQAAMGLVQLARLPDFIHRRREIAQRYDAGLRGLPLRLPIALPGHDSIYFRYVVRVADAESLLTYLRGNGVAVARPVFKPCHLLLAGVDECPVSLRLWRESVSLPIYPLLQNAEVDRVITTIWSYCQKYSNIDYKE